MLATVVEILTLRLQMIKIQRDAIESDHRIALLECKYEKEKKEMDQRMVNSIAKLRDNYSREYHQRDKQYDKELETLEKKIAKAISRYEEGTEKEKIREERLKEALEKATIK